MLVSFLSGKNQHRGFRIRRSFCKSALSVFNIRVQFKGNPKTYPGLYISNHRSMLDPLVELSLIDAFILSKAEVNSYPMIGRGAKETGVFFVDRLSDNSRKAAVLSIGKILTEGSPLLIYPEGTTYGGDLTGDFRKGAFEIAFTHKIPVIPIMIEYPDSSYYWTEGSLMNYFRRIFSRPGTHNVMVQVGSALFGEDSEVLVAKTKAEIDRMILEARKTSK